MSLETHSLSFVLQFRKMILLRLYNSPMREAPEFDPKRPVSAAPVIRAVLLDPRGFYGGFSMQGPVKGPALFVLLLGVVSAVLYVVAGLLVGALLGGLSLGTIGLSALRAGTFALISPVLVGVVAAVYLLSIRTFLGRVSDFREVYRMLAYACSAMVLAWVPVLNALAFTYALMVLMGIAVKTVYKIPTLTAVVICLVGFVPVALAFIWVQAALAGLLFG